MKKHRLMLLELHDARFSRIVPEVRSYADVRDAILRNNQPVIMPQEPDAFISVLSV